MLHLKTKEPATFNTEVDAADGMYCIGRDDHYIRVGQQGAALLKAAVEHAGLPAVRDVLDLPCGHGRVARHLTTTFPGATVTVSDIDAAAVDFCVSRLGASAGFVSNAEFKWFLPSAVFDAIFVGSLFTHLNADRWRPLLCALKKAARSGAVIVFTTQGDGGIAHLHRDPGFYGVPRGPDLIRRYETVGFGYENYPGQSDYGISVSRTEWVEAVVNDVGGLHTIDVKPSGWDNHQDVFVVRVD
jgi:SAM-dependent methyltransferase